MRNVLIVYLRDEDKSEPAYKAMKAQANRFDYFEVGKVEELSDVFNKFNSDNESLVITILSHGHLYGINIGTTVSLMTWSELCKNVNSLRTNFPITLNLIGICNSIEIVSYKNKFGAKIDKIWGSTNFVDSINKGLQAAQSISFYYFVGLLDYSEAELYKEIL